MNKLIWIILLALMTGCASAKIWRDETGVDRAVFRGWGSFKTKDGAEIKSKPLISIDIEKIERD